MLLAFAVIRLRLPLISCAACPWIRALLRGGFLSSVGATIMEIGVPRSQARLSVYGAMWRLDEVFLSDDGVRARALRVICFPYWIAIAPTLHEIVATGEVLSTQVALCGPLT